MTLIEFFDSTPVNNIAASLALRPDRTIYISTGPRRVAGAIPIYRRLLSEHGISCDIWVKIVARNDIDGITDSLNGIISDPSESYVIDITGGDETALVALGIVLGSTDKTASAFRMNPASRRGTWFDVIKDKDGRKSVKRTGMDFGENTQVYLTNAENIYLHSGKIVSESHLFSEDDPVCGDIDRLWELCRADCSGWNARINRLSSAVSQYTKANGRYIVSADSIGERVDGELWNILCKEGFLIIDDGLSENGVYIFEYKNPQVYDCLTKAGSLFEYYVYKTALKCRLDGVRVFDSATTGVVLGWNSESASTKNEIDVMLMHGLVPVFISCKNGDIKTDELYKLSAVSEKFGSDYAKFALASTVYFDKNERGYAGDGAVENLKRRASDMNIRTISQIHKMSEADLMTELTRLVMHPMWGGENPAIK